MRSALLLAAAGATISQASLSPSQQYDLTDSEVVCTPHNTVPSSLPATEPSPSEASMSTEVVHPSTPGHDNGTAVVTTTDMTIVPDETATDGPGPTAAAISQPMKTSICGLLGFLMVALVMF